MKRDWRMGTTLKTGEKVNLWGIRGGGTQRAKRKRTCREVPSKKKGLDGRRQNRL